jgi:hypothetical protein
MRRIVPLLIVPLLCACKKPKKDPEPEPPPGPPKVGHSVTKMHGSDDEGSGSGSGSAGSGSAGSAVAATPDAPPGSVVGGNGAPAFRDAQGRVHGPGGPVFMGRGVDCDAAHDHCLRPDVWFSVGNIVPGKLYRALPVYKLEDKWWTWRGDEEQPVKVYMTKQVGTAKLSPGTPVIWFSSDTSAPKWADSEYEALTSSRWEAGVVDLPSSGGTVKIKGWGAADMDTVRVIVQVKDP